MNHCSNLYFLSTIACQLADCLDKDDLAILAADLVVLSDLLANILVRMENTSEITGKPDAGECFATNRLP
ncbi:MAG: DUF6774 domain-containing protein [Coprococcus sp.]